MKKFLVLVLTVAVLASSFVLPSMAETAPENIGGFDFYSITFHYSEPTVIGYSIEKVAEEGSTKKVSKYVFADAVDSYTVYVKENKQNQVLNNQSETIVTNAANATANFFSVKSDELMIGAEDLYYSVYPSASAYITQIQNNTAIVLKDTSSIAGLVDFYDQTGAKNPNLVEQDGYFVDAATGNKLDDNGFVIDANNLWHEESGIRVEAFIENVEGKLIWIPYKDRVVDGKALVNSEVNGTYLIEKGLLPAYPEFDPEFDYNEDGEKGTKRAQTADKKVWNEKKTSYESAFIQLYRIKTDTDNNGKYSKAELAAADDLNRTFTEADIETFTNAAQVTSFVRGTPVVGTAKTKSTITSVTIEIDALGTQLYSDVSADPQQKNTIVLTTGSVLENVKTAESVVANDPTKYNNVGVVVGTAKAVTTKTSMDLTKNAEITAKSVKIEAPAEKLAEIKNGVDIYLNFSVGTLQPTEGVKIEDTYNPKGVIASMSVYKIDESDIPLKPVDATEKTEEDSGINTVLIIAIIAGCAVAVIAVVVVVIVLTKKKKAKVAVTEESEAAPVAEEASSDGE